ncbi:MAG TPA: winged helix-turn-helix domain-containing protein [Blastocatellia bacterium]|nr:winged helix-turn-helix domain-containing protein [Blastocatellia bacterium]
MKQIYEFGPFRLDPARRVLRKEDDEVALTPKAFETLLALVEANGQLLEKDALMQRLWPDSFVEEGNLTVYISTLRKALGENRDYIQTIPNRGYRFAANVHEIWDAGSELVVEERMRARMVIAEPPMPEAVPLPVAHRAAHRGWGVNRQSLLVAALILGALALAIGWGISRLQTLNRSASRPALNFVQVVSWKNEPGESLDKGACRFSHDGQMVAFSRRKNGYSNIWIKQLVGGEPIQVTKDQWNDTSPIWRPDNQQIAFVSNRDGQLGIWMSPIINGTPTPLKILGPEGPKPVLLFWSNRTDTLYYQHSGNLYALEIAAGVVRQVTDFDASSLPAKSFAVSPDEARFAYTDAKNGENNIWVASFNDREATPITHSAEPKGSLIWHPQGDKVLFSANQVGVNQVWLAYLDGRQPTQLTSTSVDNWPSDVSPDGTRILVLTRRDDADLWSVNIESARKREITSEANVEMWPRVSPDGARIAFQSTNALDKLINSSILVKPTAAAGEQRRLLDNGYSLSWSPDSSRIAFLRYIEDRANLWSISALGGNEQQLTTNGVRFGGYTLLPCDQCQAEDYSWSTDGKRLVYITSQSGQQNLWEVSADGSGARQMTSLNDKNLSLYSPLWSPDGTHVAYVSETRVPLASGEKRWAIHMVADRHVETLFESGSLLRLLGWSPSGENLFVASTAGVRTYPVRPTAVDILSISATTGEHRVVAQINAVYFASFRLSQDRAWMAFVSERDEAGMIWIMSANGGEPRKVVEQPEPRIYLSGLVWSPDSKDLYYMTQSSTSLMSLIDNYQ